MKNLILFSIASAAYAVRLEVEAEAPKLLNGIPNGPISNFASGKTITTIAGNQATTDEGEATDVYLVSSLDHRGDVSFRCIYNA